MGPSIYMDTVTRPNSVTTYDQNKSAQDIYDYSRSLYSIAIISILNQFNKTSPHELLPKGTFVVIEQPIVWFSKRQRTVESSTFGSEYIATKTCVEAVQALRFKLRMFGVPIDGPCRVFNDNQSAVKNSSRVESTLTKRHNQLAYHLTRWAVATGSVIVSWIPTNGMLADPLTKRMPSKASRDDLFYQLMY